MKVVSLFSGGLDSTTLAYLLREQGHELRLLSVNYGQRHYRELNAAQAIAYELGYADEGGIVAWATGHLKGIDFTLDGSSQTNGGIEVPEGHYAEESMKATVVPNRNMLLLATATAWAISTGSDAVAYGAHAGDHAIYPDCRPQFVAAMAAVMKLCDYKPIELLAPFISLTKADIVKLGAELAVPFEKTWSCYQGGDIHCGRCGTCVERIEAFQLAGIYDATEYEDRAFALRQVGLS